MYNFGSSIIHTVSFIEFVFVLRTDTFQVFVEIVGTNGIELFVSFPQQFRIDGHFLFERFVFANRKVVAVENIENSVTNIAFFSWISVRKKFVGKGYIGMYPVVIVDGIEKPSVQERNLAVETAVVVVIVTTIGAQCFVEKRFEYFVEKIGVVAIFFFE
ncbi:MAG: hypothetical protein BWZ06_01277 [Bacteroidetes bacterium ADurb.BinA261]|nr:MAG: hypothetical protein BWZ06_01277 [Bacteroidetes bacterium ADurb.BinA261]